MRTTHTPEHNAKPPARCIGKNGLIVTWFVAVAVLVTCLKVTFFTFFTLFEGAIFCPLGGNNLCIYRVVF